MKRLATGITEHLDGPFLSVKEIRIGMDQIHKRHFMSIFLEEAPRDAVIKKIVELLHHDHTTKGGPFMQREFVGKEIHIYPSPLSSKKYFNNREAAIKEYRRILRSVLRIGRRWYRTMQLDGSLLPFEQRMAI